MTLYIISSDKYIYKRKTPHRAMERPRNVFIIYLYNIFHFQIYIYKLERIAKSSSSNKMHNTNTLHKIHSYNIMMVMFVQVAALP